MSGHFSDGEATKRMAIPVALLLISFTLAMFWITGVLPDGMGWLVSLAVELFLRPTGLFVFILAGVLAPPWPFVTGALLGALDGVLWTVLGVAATEPGMLPVTAVDAIGFILVATIFGSLFTGIIGWVANAILRRRVATTDQQVFTSWPPSRTWKPCVQCNTPVQPNVSFCSNCGAPVSPPQ